MRRRWVKYVLLGLCAYVLALIAYLPARHSYDLALKYSAPSVPLRLHELDGSLWSGSANTLAWRGTRLGAIQWTLSPWPMLLGRLALDFRLQEGDGAISGHVSLASDGRITLTDIDARLPVTALRQFGPVLPFALDGNLAIRLEEAAALAQGTPHLRGNVVWSQAQLLAAHPLQLGDLRLALQPTAAGETEGMLSDAGGPLEINGKLTLGAGNSYRLEARLRARAGAASELGKTLALLGSPDVQGYHSLRLNGRL